MHRLAPQANTRESNALVAPLKPTFGQRIRVRVGEPVDISDLLADFEAQRGARRRLASVDATGTVVGWQGSTPEERALYSAIALRVQAALLELEADAKDDFVPL